MKTLDERFYEATLTQPDYAAAVYEFIDSLNTVDEVKNLWRDHFCPDDDFVNHCFGMACWARINKIEGKQNGKEKSEPRNLVWLSPLCDACEEEEQETRP